MRIYRDVTAGVTWIERGTGTPLLVVNDHGAGAGYEWRVPDPQKLIYDDKIGAVEDDHLDDARDRLLAAIGAAKMPATAKAEMRELITKTISG